MCISGASIAGKMIFGNQNCLIWPDVPRCAGVVLRVMLGEMLCILGKEGGGL